MEWKMNPNAVNQFPKGATVYKEGQPVSNVAMIIKGRVLIHNDGAKILLGSGSFLGINDMYLGRFHSTYTAYDDLILYVFPIQRVEELENILAANKDYHGFMVASFYKLIYELDQIYRGIMEHGTRMYQFLTSTYKGYIDSSKRWGYNAKASERIEKLIALESDLELLEDRVRYYSECRNIPVDAVKLFYSYGNVITQYQVEDQSNIVNQQMEALKELAVDFISMTECLVDDTDNCLFRLIAQMSLEMNSNAGGNKEYMDIIDDIIDEINLVETFTERMIGKNVKVNRQKMEEIYHLLLTGNKAQEVSSETFLKYSKEEAQRALEELKDSFQTIISYAEIEPTKTETMKSAMQDFVYIKDKTSTEDSVRALRRQLIENHYLLYHKVFVKAHQDKKVPRIIDLFLSYGFADERLLTKEQLLSLYFLENNQQNKGLCNIYNIKSWLTLIYEGKREPSKNEFDMEYSEMVTDLRKQGKIAEKDVAQWLTNTGKKLEYEIQNMFRYNNRTTNGQISNFVPFLYKEQYAGNFDKVLLTVDKLNIAIGNLLKIDYSIFSRDILYMNPEKNITKEYMIKSVYPEFILMPNVGVNGIMWQEISGKRRDSSARFLLPIFTEASIAAIITRIFGRYRWEICRTVEGSSWNDIKVKSLTSEYSDYLQFFRKNKELSEEKREKIKLQIQKGRNSSKEIFTLDYEQWINYESTGAIKLNKPVREIMATYCPFSKDIREQLKTQPIFAEAMTRYYKIKQQKIRETDGRLRMLQKEQIELPKELVDTLSYYRDK
jgi:hypothetical protein